MPHRECSRNIYWRFFYLSSKATYWRGRNRTCLLSHNMLVASQMLHANRKDFPTMPFLRLSTVISISLARICTTHALTLSSFVQGLNSAPYAFYLHLCVSLLPPQRWLKTQKSTDLGFSSCFLCLQCYSVTYPKRLNYQALPNSFSLLFLYDLALLANNFHLNIQHLHKSPIFIICHL